MTKQRRQAAAKRLRKALAAMNDSGRHWIKYHFVGEKEGEEAFCALGGIVHVSRDAKMDAGGHVPDSSRFDSPVYAATVVALAEEIARRHPKRIAVRDWKERRDRPAREANEIVVGMYVARGWAYNSISGRVTITSREDLVAMFEADRARDMVREAEYLIMDHNDRPGTRWDDIVAAFEAAATRLETA